MVQSLFFHLLSDCSAQTQNETLCLSLLFLHLTSRSLSLSVCLSLILSNFISLSPSFSPPLSASLTISLYFLFHPLTSSIIFLSFIFFCFSFFLSQLFSQLLFFSSVKAVSGMIYQNFGKDKFFFQCFL